MAKEKIGVFSEADAKKIARAVQKFINQPSGNRGRQRKRVVSGGAPGSFDECGFGDLEIVEVTTGYKIMVIDEEGCLKAAEFSECPPADATEEFSSASFFPGLGV